MKKLSRKTKIIIGSTVCGLVSLSALTAVSVACSQPYSAPFNTITTSSGQYPDRMEGNYSIGSNSIFLQNSGKNVILANNTFSTSATIDWTGNKYQGANWKNWPWGSGNPGQTPPALQSSNEIPPLTYVYCQWFYWTSYNSSINGGGQQIQPITVNAGPTANQNIEFLQCIISIINGDQSQINWPNVGPVSGQTLDTSQAMILSRFLRNWLSTQVTPYIQTALNNMKTAGQSGYTFQSLGTSTKNNLLNLANLLLNSLTYYQLETLQQQTTPLSSQQIGQILENLSLLSVSNAISTGSALNLVFNGLNSSTFASNTFEGSPTIQISPTAFSASEASKAALKNLSSFISNGTLKLNWCSVVPSSNNTLTTSQLQNLNQALWSGINQLSASNKQKIMVDGQLPVYMFQSTLKNVDDGTATALLSNGSGSIPVKISGFPTKELDSSSTAIPTILKAITTTFSNNTINWPQVSGTPATVESWSPLNDALLGAISNYVANNPTSSLATMVKGYNLSGLQINPKPESFNGGDSLTSLPGSGTFTLKLGSVSSQNTINVAGFQYTISPGTGYFEQILNPLNNGNNTNNPSNLDTSSSGDPFLPNDSAPQNGIMAVYSSAPTPVQVQANGSNLPNEVAWQSTASSSWHVNPQYLTYISKNSYGASILRLYCNFYSILAAPSNNLYDTAVQNGNINAFSNPTIPNQISSVSNQVGSNDGFAVSHLWDLHVINNYTYLLKQEGIGTFFALMHGMKSENLE